MKNGPYELVVAPTNYPGKLYRNRYCYEHHLVFWQHQGLIPSAGEQIHHKNENKRDNRIENLELVTNTTHGLRHRKEKLPNTVCGNCSKPFWVRPYKLKKKFNFCSRICYLDSFF